MHTVNLLILSNVVCSPLSVRYSTTEMADIIITMGMTVQSCSCYDLGNSAHNYTTAMVLLMP